jgi:hypothetical protein
MNDGMSEGIIEQSLECSERFSEDFVSNVFTLTLVPGRRRG